MKRAIVTLCAAALVAACGGGEEKSAADVEQYANDLGTDAATSREPKGGGAKAVAESNDVWEFEYSYPAAAGAIPELRALLDGRLTKSRDDLRQQAIDGRAEADESGFPFNPYSLKAEWKVVTNLPRWLSLSGDTYSFSGGAHGNYGFAALLWDKQAKKALVPESVFVSTAALEAAVRAPFCAALNQQRAEKREEPIDPASTDMFDVCPGIGETTVILGSSNSRTFDRVGFLIDPYVAGPWAEGSYEVTLPVTKAVKAAVKPAFADSFTATR